MQDRYILKQQYNKKKIIIFNSKTKGTFKKYIMKSISVQ